MSANGRHDFFHNSQSGYKYEYFMVKATCFELKHFKSIQKLCKGEPIETFPVFPIGYERFDSSLFVPLCGNVIDTLTAESGYLFARLMTLKRYEADEKYLVLYMPETRMTLHLYYVRDTLVKIESRYSSEILYSDRAEKKCNVWIREIKYNPDQFLFTIADMEDKFRNGFKDSTGLKPPFRRSYQHMDEIELINLAEDMRERLFTNKYFKGVYFSSFCRYSFPVGVYSTHFVEITWNLKHNVYVIRYPSRIFYKVVEDYFLFFSGTTGEFLTYDRYDSMLGIYKDDDYRWGLIDSLYNDDLKATKYDE